MDLALEQGEVEKRINAVQDEVKKQDDAIKELQKKLKVNWYNSCVCRYRLMVTSEPIIVKCKHCLNYKRFFILGSRNTFINSNFSSQTEIRFNRESQRKSSFFGGTNKILTSDFCLQCSMCAPNMATRRSKTTISDGYGNEIGISW
jgi:hypothetical protein